MRASAPAALAAFLLLPAEAFARPAVPIAPAAGRSRPVPVAGVRPDHDWPKYCADAAMTGLAHNETKISAASAGTLALLWKIALPGAIASSPTVVSDRLYVGDWSGGEWELDASKGEAEATIYGGVAISDGRVFFGDTAGNLYAYRVPGP